MAKFGLFVCMFLLGLAGSQSMDEEDIVRYCKKSLKVSFHKLRPTSSLYDPPSNKCIWDDSAPDGYQVRFVCREILNPDDDICKIDYHLLRKAASHSLLDFACGKKYFNVFSNGPVLKLKLNNGEEGGRTFRCDLDAVPEKHAACNCKRSGDSNDFSCLAAVLTTKMEHVRCPAAGPEDRHYHLASGYCALNLTPEQIAAEEKEGDTVTLLRRHSKYIPQATATRIDYEITLAAVQKNAKLNWNVIPLCLQGDYPVNDFQGEIVTIKSPAVEEDSEDQCMEVKHISKSQCSSRRVKSRLDDRQICNLNVNLDSN